MSKVSFGAFGMYLRHEISLFCSLLMENDMSLFVELLFILLFKLLVYGVLYKGLSHKLESPISVSIMGIRDRANSLGNLII